MTDNITELRNIQLELLQSFAGVCEEHGLKWYAFFGTLLGIKRNEGYLPWDDDVDVAMPAEDYRALCEHREWFDPEYFLQTPLDPGFNRFAKLRKNGTTAFREDFIDCLKNGGHHGIYIDIIPLAELPGMEAYHTPTIMDAKKQEAVYLKSWFEPYATARFEELELRIPANSRKVLNAAYEDWAWPHGARESCPTCWFADTHKGYEYYIRRYTGMLNDIDGKKLIFFGAADTLRIWLERFERRNQVVCTMDNDPCKWGKRVYGVEVHDPKELPSLVSGDTRIIIVSLYHQEIGRQLEQMGIDDYYVYLDDYYDENIGNRVIRREDLKGGDDKLPMWKG